MKSENDYGFFAIVVYNSFDNCTKIIRRFYVVFINFKIYEEKGKRF